MTIKALTLELSEDQAKIFEGRDVMITPVSDNEAASVGAFHIHIGAFLGALPDRPQISNLAEGNRIAMAILDRSIRVAIVTHSAEETIQ